MMLMEELEGGGKGLVDTKRTAGGTRARSRRASDWRCVEWRRQARTPGGSGEGASASCRSGRGVARYAHCGPLVPSESFHQAHAQSQSLLPSTLACARPWNRRGSPSCNTCIQSHSHDLTCRSLLDAQRARQRVLECCAARGSLLYGECRTS